jgi:hypothetical protein
VSLTGGLPLAMELAHASITQRVEVVIADLRKGQRMSHQARRPAPTGVRARAGSADDQRVGEVFATLLHCGSEEI